MFIRFVCPAPHPVVRGAEAGIWWAQYELLDAAEAEARLRRKSARVRRRHEALLDDALAEAPWEHLRQPIFASVPQAREGLFWFTAEARVPGRGPGTLIEATETLARALRRTGVPIRRIQTRDPGRIIWDDMGQVLAIPERPVLCAFHRR